jgi:hypothetical protein
MEKAYGSDRREERLAPGRGMTRTRLTALIIAAITAGAATPYDPDAVFFDGKVLQGALVDIAKMQAPELRAFTQYLSACNATHSDVGLDACEAAYTAYEIEFGQRNPNRPLDDLIVARALRETKLRTGVTAAMTRENQGKIVEEIIQQTAVVEKLEDAARARFQVLRASTAR